MLMVITLSIIYTEGYCTECLYALFRYAEDPCAEGQYAEDHYAEGHFAVCHYPEYHYPSFEYSKSGNTYRRGRFNTTDNLISGGHRINLLNCSINRPGIRRPNVLNRPFKSFLFLCSLGCKNQG
jgi:hypothetical protein